MGHSLFIFKKKLIFLEGILKLAPKRGDSNLINLARENMGESKRMAIIFAAVSLICAMLAAVLFLNMVKQTKEKLGDTVQVMAAAKEIPPMTNISADMLTTVEIPRRLAGNFTFTGHEGLLNQTTIIRLSAGEIFTENIIKEKTSLPPNSRVVQLRPPVAVFDGEYKFGDKVDIVVSYKENARDISETLFHNVTVVNQLQLKGEETTSLGIVLTDKEVETMVWMLNYGKEVRVVKAG